ncbi:signal transduction histidine kinase [Streptacidiphilus sp. MAP12-16]|uniref:sensor histidine kinase n=1 Tax=Streptacidiphilus sp. MAP12-16 TaxID=3156300 RepID=UPI003516F7FF
MRFRSRSVRAKIIALLLVPLASLTGLWAYTTAGSVSQVWGLIQVSTDYRWFGTPADDLSRALQDERRAAVAYAAAPAGKGDLDTLHRAEVATDQLAAVVRAHASDAGKLADLNATQRLALNGVLTQIAGLPASRGQTEHHQLGWDDVYQWYTDAQTPFFTLRLQLSDLQAGDLTREAGNLIELVRAREYISREDALMSGARAAGHFTESEFQNFLATIDGGSLLFSVYQPQLPDQEAALFTGFTSGQDYATLAGLQEQVSGLGVGRAVAGVDAAHWQTAANSVLDQLSRLDVQAATIEGDRARSYAMGVIWRDGAVGLAGLLAVLLTLLVSLRIGRGLVRELVELRNSAFELAGVRLPEVMRRLRDGERVDLASEVPEVPARMGEHDEIAQVGRAFNAVQRAAVEAAVQQAELRRGIAAVFVNLARRSQALLHRQLTLLDEMERRAEDPDELEDLFRLDHLTTRMRRHAEGLIILSGSAPGRTWRRPVRVLDVVRAAVGEVEDYARVRVHRMPPVAVVGGAVSDVIHLVAELVENAAVFSPPHTQVRIQGEEVANGFALEIDDRGLGMGEEALIAANNRLATGGDFDLADSDRLGLFVVSRLSTRHGVRVSLRRSPYGGTTAVVLLPRELLAPVSSRPGDASAPDGDETSEPALPVQRRRMGRELPQSARIAAAQSPTRPRPAVPAVPADGEPVASPLPRRRALPTRADSYLAARDGARDGAAGDGSLREGGSGDGGTREGGTRDGGTRDASVRDLVLRGARTPEAPAQDASTPQAPAQAPAPVAPLLPRRVRQANLAPQLRVAAAEEGEGHRAHPEPEQPAGRERSPEEVRATFASFQRGLSRGRATPQTLSEPAPEPVGPGGEALADPPARAAGTPESAPEGTHR